MPIDPNHIPIETKIENHGWQKINKNHDQYYRKFIEPQLNDCKTWSSTDLIRKLPQIQFDQFYQQLIWLKEFTNEIQIIFENATNDYLFNRPTKQNVQQNYHPRIFLKNLYQAIDKFQNKMPKNVLNNIDYRQKLNQIGRYLPKHIVNHSDVNHQPEYAIDVDILHEELHNVFNNNYRLLTKSPEYYYGFRFDLIQKTKALKRPISQKMLVFWVSILQMLINIRIRIVHNYIQTRIQKVPMPKELAHNFYTSEYLSWKESQWLATHLNY